MNTSPIFRQDTATTRVAQPEGSCRSRTKTRLQTLLLTVALLAGVRASAQDILGEVDFTTRLNNLEFSGNEFGESATYFAARLTPAVGLEWNERNRLMVGVEMLQDFGDGSDFLTDAKPLIYYTYESPKVRATAGIFPRSQLIGRYCDAFYSSNQWFYNNRIQGFLANYRADRGYAEFALDWEGMRTTRTREKFRILSAGEYKGEADTHLYAAYAFSLLHYAKSANETPDEGVVDYIMVNPYAGIRFSAFFDFDIRLAYLQTIQRDRRTDRSWSPQGGQFYFSMSRWGLSLCNQLYVGANLMPMWEEYGRAVYSGLSFYSTTKHIFNKTVLDYERRFFNNTLGIRASFVFHYDGVGLGVQQKLTVNVNLLGKLYRSKGNAVGKKSLLL